MQSFELRPLRLSDAASLAVAANDIRIWNNLRDYFPSPYTVDDGLRFISLVRSKPSPAVDLAIVIGGSAVGVISIIPQSDVTRITAKLGYWLGVSYWNRGIMTSAILDMSSYAFSSFPILHKLFAPVFSFNLSSQRVLQKSGFTLEAILPQSALKNGRIIDLHYYTLINPNATTENRNKS